MGKKKAAKQTRAQRKVTQRPADGEKARTRRRAKGNQDAKRLSDVSEAALQVARRRREVERLAAVYAIKQAEVAELLQTEWPGITAETVENDLRALRKQWREQTQDNLEELAAELRERRLYVIREARLGWDRSKQDAETIEYDAEGNVTKRTVKGQSGDPRFLQAYSAALRDDEAWIQTTVERANRIESGQAKKGWNFRIVEINTREEYREVVQLEQFRHQFHGYDVGDDETIEAEDWEQSEETEGDGSQ